MTRVTGLLMLAAFALMPHATAQAQERRLAAGIDVGAATTWDDEGMLGRGAAVAGDVSLAVTDRLTIRGAFDRVPYYRDTSWLRLDGRFSFIGAEIERRFGRGTVRPFILGGAGVVAFSDAWTNKTAGSPFETPIETTIERSGTFGAAVAGSGLDIVLSPRFSLRPTVKVYMMGPDSDLYPRLSVRPGVGIAVRW